ncbi:unnamed protein product, partial [Tetraodon nigroviridis]
ALLAADMWKASVKVTVEEGQDTRLRVSDVVQFSDCDSISRYLARVAPALGLYGSSTMEQTEDLPGGHALTLADISVWASLKGQAEWPSQARSFSHVSRWFFFLSSQVPFSAVGNKYSKKSLPLAKSTSDEKKQDVGKFVDLPGAEMGKVVVRFPPEASG